MMAQYVEIKIANPDSLLFYRMGDFYELFFEDAEKASRALGITLTKRGKHQGEDIPMCGVPVHSADGYLQQLIALGFRVAVCEQLEDPIEAKKRGAKSVVKRDVVRLVTPGTLTEDNLLEAGANNFLASLARIKGSEEGHFALAWVDLSTGEFQVATTSFSNLEADIARIAPKELILSDALFSESQTRKLLEAIVDAVVPQPAAFFESTTADERIKRFYAVASLDAFGVFSRAECSAAAAILSYIEKTQIGEKPALSPPTRLDTGSVMLIDPATRANLEITKTLSGEKKGSLLATINMTVTGGGARLLAKRIANPSLQCETINQRLDAVGWFLEARAKRQKTRDTLKAAPDILRCLSRLTLSRGGPRDMAAIGKGLEAAHALHALLSDQTLLSDAPKLLQDALSTLQEAPQDLADLLSSALREELPLLKRDGGFIAKGYDAALDETCALRDESRKVIASLQIKYAELADIKALKVRHNNVLGYFIEVTAQHGERMLAAPLNETFIHRQTLANNIRFTTTELSELQTNIVNAADRARGMELAIYDTLEEAIVALDEPIKKVARAMAELDVAAANAELAERRHYCPPQIDDSLAFAIDGGRHPVVERALSQAMSDPFVANNCDLSGNAIQGTDQGEEQTGGQGGGMIWLVTVSYTHLTLPTICSV